MAGGSRIDLSERVRVVCGLLLKGMQLSQLEMFDQSLEGFDLCGYSLFQGSFKPLEVLAVS